MTEIIRREQIWRTKTIQQKDNWVSEMESPTQETEIRGTLNSITFP